MSGRAGVAFAGGAAEFRPREERRDMFVPAVMTLFPRRAVAVTLYNLSASGFAAECDFDVPIGSQLILEIAGAPPAQAQVRWSIGGRFGAQFNGCVDLFEEFVLAGLPAPVMPYGRCA